MDNWYAKREKYRPDYNILADALDELLCFGSVLDIGSANGFLLDVFHSLGKRAKGIELSEDAKPYMSDYARENTYIGDATKTGLMGKFNLVTCVEVAEHIPYSNSDKLVKTITSSAEDYIYFTAATPFQGGNGHINCQPHFFWLNKFRRYGWHLNYTLTEHLIDRIKDMKLCYWIPLNSLILTK